MNAFPGTQLFLVAGVTEEGAAICPPTCAVVTETERGATPHLSATGKSNPRSASRKKKKTKEKNKTNAPIRSDVSLIKEPTGWEVDSTTSRRTKAAFLMDCGNYSLSERQHINSTPRPLCHRSHQATVMFATEKQVQTLQQSGGGPV